MTVSSFYANVLYNIPNSKEWLSKSSSFICYRESVFKIPNNIKESIEYTFKPRAADQFQSKIDFWRAYLNKEHKEMKK